MTVRGLLRRLSVVPALLFQFCTLRAAEQPIFAAREFLLTRQFKLGRDVYPSSSGSPMAVHAGSVYLAGAFQLGTTDYQTFLRKYDASGAELWTQQIVASENVFPEALVADTGGVYIAIAVGLSRREIRLRKHDVDGKELWSRQFRISENGHHVIAGLAADDIGVYIAAWDGFFQGILRKYSLSGTKLWTRTIPANLLRGISVDESGVYVAGARDSGAFVSKFSTTGSLLWTRPLSRTDQEINIPAALVADATGIYLGGSTYRPVSLEGSTFAPESREGYVEKLDGDGRAIWRSRFGPAGTGVEFLAADSSGVYAAGSVQAALPGQCRSGAQDIFVRRYDSAGNEQWTRQFGTTGTETAGRLDVDDAALYMSGIARGGTAPGGLFLAKLAKIPSVSDDSRPQIIWECVVNAASSAGGAVTPAEIVNVFGRNMGPVELTRMKRDPDGRIPTSLAETRVLFDGVAASLLFVSATQISAIVPSSVAERPSVSIEIEYRGVRSEPLSLPVVPTHPGVFTVDTSGKGQGVILNHDGTLNSAQNPAERNSVIALYATGGGLTDVSRAAELVSVTFEDPRLERNIGGYSPAEVLSVGPVAGAIPGLLEIRVRAPEWALTGPAIGLYVQIGSAYTDPGITVALR